MNDVHWEVSLQLFSNVSHTICFLSQEVWAKISGTNLCNILVIYKETGLALKTIIISKTFASLKCSCLHK